MTQRILILGAGFGGVWSALSAVCALDNAKKCSSVEVIVIAPEPVLYIRPRFYETDLSDVAPSVKDLFDTVGIRYIQGTVTHIDTESHSVAYNQSNSIGYNRLVLATGSQVIMPGTVSGLQKHAFIIDNYEASLSLDKHLKSLASLPDSPGRNTVVVVGGGFTGIEIAAELPARLACLLGKGVGKVIVVERSKEIGPELGPGPRPVILQALEQLCVTLYTGEDVEAIDADGVITASGRRIAAKTVIWTAGVRASSLTEDIVGAELDASGRLLVDSNLKVMGAVDVYATGDTANAATDAIGHSSLMSCQHAYVMGRSSGYNAARDLLGLRPRAYEQSYYTTCLDLGEWGAVITEGWDRKIVKERGEAKRYKKYITSKFIYPPPADRVFALEYAHPSFELRDELKKV